MQCEKMSGKEFGVAMTAAQRRHVDGHDAQAVIEIGAELAGAHQLLQGPVGRGDKPYIHGAVAYSTDAADRAVLDQLQQLELHGWFDITDLVEEKRAAVGCFDQTNSAILGIGERPSLVAEQFRFEELHRQRRTVDLDERRGLSRAFEMQRARHQLFAGAGLSANQHCRRLSLDKAPLCLDQRANTLAQLLHRRRFADQPGEAATVRLAPVEVGQRALQLFLAEGLVDQDFELAENNRLRQVVAGSGLHRIDGRLHVSVPGNAHDLGPRIAPAKLVEDLEPVQIGQIQVEQDEIELGFIEKPNPFGRGSGDEDVVTASLEIALDVLGKYLFVLDQEDPARHPSSSGRRGQDATGCGGRRRSTNIYNRQWRYGLIHINRTESSLAGAIYALGRAPMRTKHTCQEDS